MREDDLTVEVLQDGSLKVTTGSVSGANHMNAEDFLRFLAQQLGGETKTQRQAHGHRHRHPVRQKQRI